MIKLYKQCSVFIAVMSLFILLQSCSTEGSGLDSSTAKNAATGAATGAVVGGVVTGVGVPIGASAGAVVRVAFGCFFPENKTTLETLGAAGVSVMRLGDTVVITIPSNKLFEGYSVQISSSGNDILEQVAKLLEPMNKVKITIAAYAEAMAQSKKDLILTQWQAQTVSNYLWDHHVDVRLLYAIGYGGGHPMQYTPNKAVDKIVGDRANYRVEITLKDYVQ